MNKMDEYQLRVRGRLSTAREGIKQIQAAAETAPRWIPGYGLKSECRAAIDLLEKMEERLVHKLVITLVGPSGAGKSTLLNALSGDDRLSRIGINRPTTKEVVVFCRSTLDAEILLKDLEPDKVSVESRPAAPGLEQIILVDTPDMDSMEIEKFHPVLEKTIALTDVLVCLLNAENPKRRDTIVFLKRFVDLFPGLSLYVVLNRCDRLPEAELKTVIVHDLQAHLETSWRRKVDSIFLHQRPQSPPKS
jgi:GTPase SAR1 family protein